MLSNGDRRSTRSAHKPVTLANLFSEYRRSFPDGAMEENSLYTSEIHMKHMLRILGRRFCIQSLAHGDLQDYVNTRSRETGRRGKPVSATTVKKELGTFSAVWNWAGAIGIVATPFPSKGLRYLKVTAKPPARHSSRLSGKSREAVCRNLGKRNCGSVYS